MARLLYFDAMHPPSILVDSIFNTEIDILDISTDVFEYQVSNELNYREFTRCLSPRFNRPASLVDFPYLPIGLFRSRRILAQDLDAGTWFESSGTTDSGNSRHYVADTGLYDRSIDMGFERAYGDIADYAVFALLPSYLDRGRASLVYMAERLIRRSGAGGFYRFDYERLLQDLRNCPPQRKPLVIGVSFALWEMAEKFPGTDLSGTIIIETGGMKGRRREIVREELHGIICEAFRVESVHSEYGMTELLSQAWSKGGGVYCCPPWMRVLVRDPYDPFRVMESGRGALNVIDLANLHSCSFLATQDVGEVFEDGSFTVEGRLDNSQVRGCNLMFPQA